MDRHETSPVKVLVIGIYVRGNACAPHVRAVVMTAHITGMRKSEVIFLTWGGSGPENGLYPALTRTDEDENRKGNTNPPGPYESVSRSSTGTAYEQGLPCAGQPVDNIKTAFNAACPRASITDFAFHDLRHGALNNLRLAGNDYFRIMAVPGHKTMSVFKRFNLVTADDLSQIKWKEPESANGGMDTYTGTMERENP